MIVAIHQPQFMPWLGYFDKMDRADCFVLLDNVQYKKNEWQNRNRIKTAQGWQWLTVPVSYKFPEKILEVRIRNTENWRHKHWQALRTNYARTPYWETYTASLEAFCASEWEMLVAVNRASIEWLRQALGIERELLLASEMQLSEEPTQRLVDICRHVGADTYLAGADGRKYMDQAPFAKAGIEIIFQAYDHPVYPQLFEGFEPRLSALDLVLNCGPESLEILRRGRER